MKKFALLFSSFAVVASAVAAQPQQYENLPALKTQPMEMVQMSAGVKNGAKVLVESNTPVNKTRAEGDTMNVSYTEPAGMFALGLTEDLRGYRISFHKGPAFTPLKWTNTSVGGVEFEWEYTKFVGGEATTQRSSDFDLVNSESYSVLNAPVLNGVDKSGNISSFQIDPEKIAYFFGGNCEYQSGMDNGMTTYLYSYNEGYTRFGCMEYDENGKASDGFNPATGIHAVFTDPAPNGYGMNNPKFAGYANLFHAPDSPYVITKMWSWMHIQAKKATVVDMTLYKVNEEGLITDEIVAKGSANVAASAKPTSSALVFDLYALDEDGLETDDPIVIDSAVIAVMSINKDDISVVNAVAGAGAIYPATEEHSPYDRHAMIVLDVDGEQKYLYSPYNYYNDDAMTELSSVTDWMWMVDAIFPWMFEANGNTSVKVANEGGEAKFAINSWYDMASVSASVSDGADWLDLEKAGFVDDADQNQVLTVPVAALPAGVTGRSATLTFEGPGSTLALTITQGEDSAVEVVVADKDAKYFDLSGRQVVNPEKGVYIKVSGNKAEKVVL